MSARERILVVGLGNPDRGDDGAGALVVRKLSGLAGVRAMARSGDMLALIEDWAGFETVVLVDAAAPARAPGRIVRIDPLTDDLPTDLLPASSHAFGVAETLALARALGALPSRLVVYAIEGESFAAGAPLTPAVAAAADKAAVMIVSELGALAAC